MGVSLVITSENVTEMLYMEALKSDHCPPIKQLCHQSHQTLLLPKNLVVANPSIVT